MLWAFGGESMLPGRAAICVPPLGWLRTARETARLDRDRTEPHQRQAPRRIVRMAPAIDRM